ncbi:hypothetical protein NUU61_008743 [Penicillium alfredii]|uniref:Uncharacterized protein n=1 Tax=Penicillium alfredii TaxID=1506179 RepID=A0A9W9JW90_9EURO|nr:uncharacterized protein NUU61_008743 [Penicillium alfredii]KAJ5084164.1 hypothetical protein NUU61_008743 [Penicillium alfredii]
MAEAVRRRRSIMRLSYACNTITDYTYDPRCFEMPSWLQVPPEVQEAHHQLHSIALQVIKGMNVLSGMRERRYNELCSKDMGILHHMHDPTLAPAPKIPRDALKFYVDPLHYATFTTTYIRLISEFVTIPYQKWRGYKSHLEHMASRLMGSFQYQEWRRWWQGTFVDEMWKWEVCMEGLVMPTWEEIIDDVYLMIIDWVEDSEELANTFYISSPESITPLDEPTNVSFSFSTCLV